MRTINRAVLALAVLVQAVLGTGLGQLSHQSESRGQAASVQKTDQERIVGTWRFSGVGQGGKDQPGGLIALMRFTFSKDGKSTLSHPDRSTGGKYQLLKPGQINLPFGTDEASPGIYQFDGENRLMLCLGLPGSDRPTDINGEKGKNQLVFVLERVKPGEEKATPEELAKLVAARAAAERPLHVIHFKQIGLAMQIYHGTYGHFPAHAIYSKDGQTPLLSWRVAILPYIEQEALYKEFKLDEPWDSAHNKRLIAKMPAIYEPLGQGKKGEGKTHYQVFTGPGTVFDGKKGMSLKHITDGSSNTILAIEASDAVVWTQPVDLTMPKEKNKLPALGGLFKTSLGVLFCDGAVRSFRLNPDPAQLRAAVTPKGGEVIDLKKLEAP